jgi:hypothetical protein
MKMNNKQLYNNSQINTKSILETDVIARAVIEAGEKTFIVSVYALSTDIQFFFVNEQGERAGTYHKQSGPWTDFNSFVNYLSNFHKGTIISSKIYSSEQLLAITIKPAHFSVTSDWTPFVNSTNPKDYRIMNRRLESKVRSTPMFWPTRK